MIGAGGASGYGQPLMSCRSRSYTSGMTDDDDTKRNLREFRESVAHEFARVDERFARIDEQFARVDERLAHMDEQLGDVRDHLAGLTDQMTDHRAETRDRMAIMETAILNSLRDHGKALSRIERRIDSHTHGPEAA